MVGFIGPFVCGACVVHLRTLRPEFVRDAMIRYRITYMALVPMILKNLEQGLEAKFDELAAFKRFILEQHDRNQPAAHPQTAQCEEEPEAAAKGASMGSVDSCWR